MVFLAFIGMSLAWSFSWFAMKLQVDSFLPPELSVFYRFFFAAILMFGLCFITKQRAVLTRKEVPYLISIGASNFFFNFLIGYFAVKFIPSGVMAVIFSLSIITSEVISSFIDNRKIQQKVVISSIVGVIGLAFFILPVINFSGGENSSKTLFGFALSLLMMVIFSFGNVLVGKNRKINSTPLYTTIAYGSGFGAIFLFLVNVLRGNEFTFDSSTQYVLSLSYLVIVATALAFICLFYLIQKIGSARANYTALVYPAIALITSSFFENFHFTFFSTLGFLMIISALAIEFIPTRVNAK